MYTYIYIYIYIGFTTLRGPRTPYLKKACKTNEKPTLIMNKFGKPMKSNKNQQFSKNQRKPPKSKKHLKTNFSKTFPWTPHPPTHPPLPLPAGVGL